MRYLEMGCRAFLVVVFAWSVVGKLRSRAAFADFLRSLEPVAKLPAPIRPVGAGAAVLARVRTPGAGAAVLARVRTPGAVLAVGLLAAEAATLVALALSPAPGLILACLLLAALTTGVMVIVRRGTAVECRCFGAGERRIGVPHIVRNGLLSLAALVGLAAHLAGGDAAVRGPGVLVAVGSAAILAVAAVHLDDLVDLFAGGTGELGRR